MAAEERVPPATAVDDKTSEVALALFDHLEDQINRTDTKAQVVLAADAADAADVSRRTAYRYFPTQEQLLIEAVLEDVRPSMERVFEPPALAHDVEARLDALVQAIYAELRSTEPLMRMMIRLTVERGREEDTGAAAPVEPPRRGYRRIDWIEMALEPVRLQLDEPSFGRLVSGIALCIGIEALLVLRDIRGLDQAEAEEVSRWAVRSLLQTEGGGHLLLRMPFLCRYRK